MHQTSAEAKAEYQAKMGHELGEVFAEVVQELWRIHMKWHEYVVLFGTKESRIDLMNEAAPRFFGVLESSLWEDVLLSIARLADNPQVAGKETLSVKRIPALIADPGLAKDVAGLVAKSLDAAQPCRDWRNRRIAHNDLNLSLDRPHAKKLADASRLTIREALGSFTRIINRIALFYGDFEIGFEHMDGDGDAEELLRVLSLGLRTRKKALDELETNPAAHEGLWVDV